MADPKLVALVHSPVEADAPPEQLDTLVQAEAIRGVLEGQGWEVRMVPFVLSDIAAQLMALKPAWIFNLVEFIDGKDRLSYLAPALYEALGIPYTGNPPRPLLLCCDKVMLKRLLRDGGIPTPAWFDMSSDELPAMAPGGRFIIKSVSEHGSFGITDASVREISDLDEGKRVLREFESRFQSEFYAEQFIDGRELNIGMTGSRTRPIIFPPAEMAYADYAPDKLRIMTYTAKWEKGTFEYAKTDARFSFAAEEAPLLAAVTNSALRCWSLFGLNGACRFDFRVGSDGIPYMLEFNANPCLNPNVASYVSGARQAGLSFESLIKEIGDCLIGRGGRW